jgi:predicted amidohydrolase YtcJ
MLLRTARIAGRLVDVLIKHGRVAAIGETLPVHDGPVHDGPVHDGEVVDLDGRTVLPGMWDHHVHFDQWALARQRLDLSGAASAEEATAVVAERLATRPPEAGTPLVGFGFRDALWPSPPHRDLLDRVSATVPMVMISGDLHCCWLNTAAARQFGRTDHPTGVINESDWFPIMEGIRQAPQHLLDRWVSEAARAAAARGVVGVIDFEASWQLDTWQRRIAAGVESLRVHCSVWPDRLSDAVRRGLRTGQPIPETGGLLTMGPLKVISDGSLNTRTAYCHEPYPGMEHSANPCGMLLVPPEELVPLMRLATENGIDSAIHAIGDRANTLVLDAFRATGARGAVEHAQLLTRPDFRRFAELGVVAGVQPEHAVDDRDVADRHWAGRTGRAFAYRDLLDAGAKLRLGSDAPVAPLDPWLALAAATSRTRGGRPSWHPEQEIPLAVALAASAGGAPTISVGDVADLVVVEEDPYQVDAGRLRSMPVAGTLLGGEWTFRDGV